jgi:osmotically-inducible protein OsmY
MAHHNPRILLIAISLLALSSTLSGCTAVVGAGATVAVAAVQERGIKGRANDLQIEARILEQFIKAGFKLTTAIGVEVYEGRVLLTGSTNDITITDKAIKLAWKISGVKNVINEIQVGVASNVYNFGQDTWITTQLKSKITFDKQIYSINYTVKTINGTVYLIGIAQNKSEHARVKQYASRIKFVRNVISHVRIKK